MNGCVPQRRDTSNVPFLWFIKPSPLISRITNIGQTNTAKSTDQKDPSMKYWTALPPRNQPCYPPTHTHTSLHHLWMFFIQNEKFSKCHSLSQHEQFAQKESNAEDGRKKAVNCLSLICKVWKWMCVLYFAFYRFWFFFFLDGNGSQPAVVLSAVVLRCGKTEELCILLPLVNNFRNDKLDTWT